MARFDATRLPPPRAPQAAIVVGTRTDAFVPPHEMERIAAHWRCELRWLEAGNASAYLFHRNEMRRAVIDAIERMEVAGVDGRLVIYERADLDELVLAYACSIHKSQESEYPCVVLPIHTQHYVMLQRNLFYTGITRARRLVVVVGSRRAMAIAVKNDKTESRFTQLAALLRAVPAGCRRT